MPEVRYANDRVLKSIQRFPADRQDQIVRDIQDRLGNLDHRTPGVSRLSSGGYRLRVGGYRVLFRREGDVVTVIEIVGRDKAYRK